MNRQSRESRFSTPLVVHRGRSSSPAGAVGANRGMFRRGSSSSSMSGAGGGGSMVHVSDSDVCPRETVISASRPAMLRSQRIRGTNGSNLDTLMGLEAVALVRVLEFTRALQSVAACEESCVALMDWVRISVPDLLRHCSPSSGFADIESNLRAEVFIVDSCSKELIAYEVSERDAQIEDRDRTAIQRRFPLAVNLVGFAVSSGRMVLLHRAKSDPRYSEAVDSLRLDSTFSSLDSKDTDEQFVFAYPFRRGDTDRHFGVFALAFDFSSSALDSTTDSSFSSQGLSPSDQSLLTYIAESVGYALEAVLERSRLLYRIQAEHEEVEKTRILLNFAKSVTIELDQVNVIERVLNDAKSLMQCDRASVFLVEEETSELVSYLADGISELRLPLDQGIVGLVAATGSVVNIPEAHKDPRFNSSVDEMTGYTTHSLLTMPIRAKGNIIGVCQMINKISGEPFSPEDEYFCSLLATFCGISIHNSLMYQKNDLDRHRLEVVFRSLGIIADENNTIEDMCGQIAELVRSYLMVEHVSIFQVTPNRNEIVSLVAQDSKQICLQIGDGIPGYVAKTGEIVITNDAPSHPYFLSGIDIERKYKTVSAVCVPIHAHGDIVGVIECANHVISSTKFENSHVEFLQSVSIVVGFGLLVGQYRRDLHVIEEKSNALVAAAQLLSTGSSESSILSTFLSHGRRIVDAERVSFFLVDRQGRELKSVIADGLDEIRVPLSHGIAGLVARTGESLNVRDAYSHPAFYSDVDHRTGFMTRNLLCVPVRDSLNRIIGVLQALNKQSQNFFDDKDHSLLDSFASFCGHAYSSKSTFEIHGSFVDFEKVCQLSSSDLDTIVSWNFFVWDYSEYKLVRLGLYMFEHLHLVDTFRIPKQNIVEFLFTIQHFYQKHVPYHNFRHAFDATQALFTLICKGNIQSCLKPIDTLVMIVGGLCHDLNHQGFNNSFMVTTSSPFGKLSSESVMESHHASLTVALLHSPRCNLLMNMSPEERSEFWGSIIEMILATDMAKHGDWLSRFREFSENPGMFSTENIEHRRMLMAILMKIADISNIARPFEIARKWAEILQVEFFNQGDVERSRGISITPIFDRNVIKLPGLQCGFIENVGIPAFREIVLFDPSLQFLMDHIAHNLARWREFDSREKEK